MARQEVTLGEEKPLKDGSVEIEIAAVDDKNDELEIEGRPSAAEKPAKPAKAASDDGIEVVDDTPPRDRNKKPSKPPEEVSDEEMAQYSERVKKRIQHFNKGYHDERRAKEQALRERAELEQYARQLLQENNKLKSNVDQSHNTMLEHAKKQVESELTLARKQYKDAYEAGDAEAILAAQDALTTAKIRADKVAGLKPKALQTTETTVQPAVTNTPSPRPVADPKAEAWRQKNDWFGKDKTMTAAALGYHSELEDEGVDLRSNEYYEKIDSRMREMFPNKFVDEDDNIDDDDTPTEQPPRKQKAPPVVAPAMRSTASHKVVLSKTQVNIAKRLGVSLAEYAKQVAELQRNTK